MDDEAFFPHLMTLLSGCGSTPGKPSSAGIA